MLEIQKRLRNLANSEKAKLLSRFFKTGEGQYGFGDKFLGITVPQQRKVALEFLTMTLEEIGELLKSEFHEERLTALLILVYKLKKTKDEFFKKQAFEFYLENTKYINNWDLVDLSAEHIIGKYLESKDREILYKLVKSENIWERRIAVLSTFHFIKQKDASDTIRIAEILLKDKHDLMHKAVGWMLREVGKRCDKEILREFLKKHSKEMPRTMLRYSIEHLSVEERAKWMQK